MRAGMFSSFGANRVIVLSGVPLVARRCLGLRAHLALERGLNHLFSFRGKR